MKHLRRNRCHAATDPTSVDAGTVLSHSDSDSVCCFCKFALMLATALARPTGIGSAVTSWGTICSNSACRARSLGITVLRPAWAAHKDERLSNNSTHSSVRRFISIKVSRLHLYFGRMARTSFRNGDSFRPHLAARKPDSALGVDGVVASAAALILVTIVRLAATYVVTVHSNHTGAIALSLPCCTGE
jgi:hypothetical protein